MSLNHVLVTGGTGFIGSHVIDNLKAKKFNVTSFDRCWQWRGGYYRADVGAYLGDVKDREAVLEAVGHCDGVIHLAATLGTQETIENPIPVVETNITGSLNVFNACKFHHKKAVYIAVGNHWMNNPYSITKTATERFALMYNKEFGTQIAIVRGLNAYGKRQKIKPVRKVVPTFIAATLKGEDIVIYGDGNQIMDMIYVEDIAEILVRALLMEHGVYDRIIEAGMGRDTTINELAELIVRLADSPSKIKHVQMRPGEESNSIVKADVKTLEWLDYPVNDMVSLEEGLRQTIEWYRNH